MSRGTVPKSFDYIIVGSGSAGAVLANRLSADPNIAVLLLEAGGPDHRWDWRLHMPAAMSYPLNSKTYNWDYKTEPMPQLNNRVGNWFRGKVLGGSSSINGMVYQRGNAMDFENWAKDPGLSNWRYAEVLPYFRRSETYDQGPDEYRGAEGPLKVTKGTGFSPLYQVFVESALQAGYPYTDDMNGYRQEGFGRTDRTIANGVRQSASRCYLWPIKRRKNLVIQTGTLATRIVVKGGRAVGVDIAHGRARGTIEATQEVIVSGGAINSPQLLLLSGIGPAEQLKSFNIPTVVDLPGVGENLQDHVEVLVQHECAKPVTLFDATKLHNKLRIGAEWLFHSTGLGASNHFETGGFIRSAAGIEWPDIQYHFLAMAINYYGRKTAKAHGFQVHVGPMRSKSRGHIRLRSTDPQMPPIITANWMTHPDDWTEMRQAIRLTREIYAQKAFNPYRGKEIAPGANRNTDADLDEFTRSHADSGYHYCGTCKMGTDELAVVDGQLRVRGVDRLRVIDASIMPVVPNANLNASSIMIGEKGADLILSKALPASNAPFGKANPSCQR
jgi:choline dehydrogenase